MRTATAILPQAMDHASGPRHGGGALHRHGWCTRRPHLETASSLATGLCLRERQLLFVRTGMSSRNSRSLNPRLAFDRDVDYNVFAMSMLASFYTRGSEWDMNINSSALLQNRTTSMGKKNTLQTGRRRRGE